MEAKTQGQLIKYLKSKGCYVIKTKPGPGTPVGCPDIIFLFEGFWGAIECKASKLAKFQPLQKETIAKLDNWSYARVAYPANVHEIIDELEQLL